MEFLGLIVLIVGTLVGLAVIPFKVDLGTDS